MWRLTMLSAVLVLACEPKIKAAPPDLSMALTPSDDFVRAQKAITLCQSTERQFPADVAKSCMLACMSEQMLPPMQKSLGDMARSLDAGLPDDAFTGRHSTRVTVNDAGVDLVVEQLPDGGFFCERAPAK